MDWLVIDESTSAVAAVESTSNLAPFSVLIDFKVNIRNLNARTRQKGSRVVS